MKNDTTIDSIFAEKFTIETGEIDLLDFSTDSIYMIFRDREGRSFCYDVKDIKNVKQIESLGLE